MRERFLRDLEFCLCLIMWLMLTKIRYTKPDPEVFIDCMEHLKLQPWECIAFEDAAAGIEAIQAANIAAVGIGASVKPAVPDVFLDNTEELSIEKIENLLYK